MRVWKRRDLTIVSGFDKDCIVIACDSCGGIGEKPGDCCKLPAYYAGKFTARVVLYELICAGSEPIVISDGLACEMEPTGKRIILGIKDELKNAGLDNITLTGSTEENFPVTVTAIGVTAIGTAPEEKLRFQKASSGDKLILLGSPVVGEAVDLESCGFYRYMRSMLSMPEIREISPVGSKGIAYEANLLASLNHLSFKPFKTDVDLRKSAGPVTCILAVCEAAAADRFIKISPEACLIGVLE